MPKICIDESTKYSLGLFIKSLLNKIIKKECYGKNRNQNDCKRALGKVSVIKEDYFNFLKSLDNKTFQKYSKNLNSRQYKCTQDGALDEKSYVIEVMAYDALRLYEAKKSHKDVYIDNFGQFIVKKRLESSYYISNKEKIILDQDQEELKSIDEYYID